MGSLAASLSELYGCPSEPLSKVWCGSIWAEEAVLSVLADISLLYVTSYGRRRCFAVKRQSLKSKYGFLPGPRCIRATLSQAVHA